MREKMMSRHLVYITFMIPNLPVLLEMHIMICMTVFIFVINSILLGIGLAMDAFSVSLANGLKEQGMKKSRMCLIASVFAGFQGVMPMIGYTCVHMLLKHFTAFSKFIPWIALALLLFLGFKMILEGLKGQIPEEDVRTGFGELMLMGVATSIDALSVGFTIAEYTLLPAILSALIIAAVTFVICYFGLHFGKKLGMKIAGKAQILGGIILIFIGAEIFIKGLFF